MMKIMKGILLISILFLLAAAFSGCNSTKIWPNQLYDYFSSGDFTANHWVRGGNVLPNIQSEQVYKGTYAVEFSRLNEDETSFLYIDLDIEADAVIRFYVRSSNESDSGILRFFIDDTIAGEWKMQNEWKRIIRELPVGEHRLRWEFENSSSEKNDTAWLDDIMISDLIPLGKKIAFTDDAFKQLILSQIGKLGGEASPVKLSDTAFFETIRGNRSFNNILKIAHHHSHMINQNCRYSNNEVYVNEVADIEQLSVGSYGEFSNPVTNITGIEYFSNLQSLYLFGPDLNDISPLRELEKIKRIFMIITSIDDITPLDKSAQKGALEELALLCNQAFNDHLTDESIAAFETWTSLKELFLAGVDIADAQFLADLDNLEKLNLQMIPITNIEPLSGLQNLTDLTLINVPVEDISPLSLLSLLQTLHLSSLPLSDIGPLGPLNALKVLSLIDLPVENIDVLSTLSGLEELWVDGLAISDISPLGSLRTLETLSLWDLPVNNIEVLSNLQNLKTLFLAGLDITDITPLQTLTALEDLEITNIEITKITALSYLNALKGLSLVDIGLSDINPLASLTGLKYLNILNTNVKDITALGNLTNVIQLQLYRNIIEDISPIVDGLISTLNGLDIRNNQLDLTPGSEDMLNIQKLIDAGVNVRY